MARVVDAIDGLAVVVPLLLAPGFHVHVDIQQAVDRPSAVASRTLGPDARLTGVLLDRLAQAGATTDDVIVLGAAGSTDVRARQSIDAAARMLGSAWGAPVPVGTRRRHRNADRRDRARHVPRRSPGRGGELPHGARLLLRPAAHVRR